MEIKRRTPFLARQNIGELLDNAFKMMEHTWRTSLLLSVMLLLPLSALLGWVVARLFAGLAKWTGFAGQAAEMLGFLYLYFALGFGAVVLLLQLAALFVYVAVSTHAAAVAGGRTMEFGEIVRLAGGKHYGRCLLQSLVQMAMISGIVTACLLVVLPPLVLSQLQKASVAGVVAAVAGVVAAVAGALLLAAAAAVWLSLLLRFAPQAVVFDGEPVFGSLQRSAHLVHGNWWRLFGISIAVGIMFSFAVGLISLPVTGAALLPLLSRLISALLSDSLEPFLAAGLLGGSAVWIAVAVAASTLIQAALAAFFMPAFFGQFYIDLKVRRGELVMPRRLAERKAPAGRKGR
jgi:hypothetical protein